jgi:hypothetical protein
MVTKLAFENFKSWRDTGDIRLAPIVAVARHRLVASSRGPEPARRGD